jgi:hypothetical protein
MRGSEILDYAWIPNFIRSSIYTSLRVSQQIGGLNSILGNHVLEELVRSKTTRVIELGSGSGSSLKFLATQAEKNYKALDMSFVLTDKYPNVKRWRHEIGCQTNMVIREEPLCFSDILKVEESYFSAGKITFLLISASHHMGGPQLKAFLLDCEKLGADVVILEPLQPNLCNAALAVLASFCGLLSPFIANLSCERRVLQFLIYYSGLGLWIQAFDGVVSTLRQRTKAEFIQIAPRHSQIHQTSQLGLLGTFTMTTIRSKKPR